MAISTFISQVHAHLDDVLKDPAKPLDEKVFEHIDRQVTEVIQEPQRDALLNKLSTILPQLQQDPTPVTNLIHILISSSRHFDFSRALAIDPPVDFLSGLTSPAPQVNSVVLSLLKKAEDHKSDIAKVAGKPDVVGALVRLWLCTPYTAIAGQAHNVLLNLLLADIHDDIASSGKSIVGRGLLWRRIFRDRQIYESIFSLCSLATAGEEGQPSKRDKTVAQARLLDLILDVDSEPFRTSQSPDIEEHYGVSDGGLLHYAAIRMVDYREDVLMHVTLLEFYAKYLSEKDCKLTISTGYPLHFLQTSGLHKRTMDYFLDPESQDPLELALLYGPSAHYLAVYCSTHPDDFQKYGHLVHSVVTRLTKVLQLVTRGQWAQGQVPNHDLHVLASVPRATLMPSNGDSPLFHLPAKPASPNAFHVLAHIFHGVDREGSVQDQERAAARTLYFLYMEKASNFWTQIVTAAETVAVKDVALAAISLIGAIITARWNQLPDQESQSSSFALPSERDLAQKCGVSSLPSSGIAAIMSEPAIGIVVPYLMKPAQTFSNLVGGGRGDIESAAYRVAVAKHDTLVLLHRELKGWVGGHPDASDIVTTVGRRVAQGPMGGTSEIGGRIGTMEL